MPIAERDRDHQCHPRDIRLIGANTAITLSLELGAHERPFGIASVPGGTGGGVDRADARPPFVMPGCPLPALACRSGGRESWSGRGIGVPGAVSWLTRGMPGGPRMSRPYSAAMAVIRPGSGGALGRGGSVRDWAGSAQERMKPSKPAGSVTSKNRAPPGELTVKVCGVPCGPNTNDPAGARTTWPPTQTVSSAVEDIEPFRSRGDAHATVSLSPSGQSGG